MSAPLTVGRRISPGLLGLIDQGLLSAASFATFLLLAQALTEEQFGAFTVTFTALLLVNALQLSLVTQPHNVIGVTRSGRAYSRFTNSTMTAQGLLGAVITVCFALASVTAAVLDTGLGDLLLISIPVALAWQAQELFRRVLYTEGRVQWALATDVAAYGGQVVLVAVLCAQGIASPALALVAIGVTSLAGAGLGAWSVRSAIGFRFDRTELVEHWEFGRWLAGAALAFGFGVHLYLFEAAALLGAEAAGAMKAAQLILAPLNVLLIFLLTTMPIRLAAALSRGGRDDLRAALGFSVAWAAPVVALYCVGVTMGATQLLALLYGERYAGEETLVGLFAMFYAVSFLGQIGYWCLTATRRSRPIFIGYVAGAGVAVGVGWLLIRIAEVEGAVLGMVATVAVQGAVVLAYSVHALRGKPQALELHTSRT